MIRFFTLLAAFPLCAHTIGNLEFELPPSQHEWTLFMNQATLTKLMEMGEGEEVEPIKERFQLYTHREGDALEILCVAHIEEAQPMSLQEMMADDIGSEESTHIGMQKMYDKLFAVFPNHRLVITDCQETENELFSAWELSDGATDVMHGYSRGFKSEKGVTVFTYMTTVVQNETNRSLWTSALNAIK